jgi:16S rRNA G966 N2-methylase RsmD
MQQHQTKDKDLGTEMEQTGLGCQPAAQSPVAQSTERREPEWEADALQVDSIRVGERARKDLGDTDALARSIDKVGLLHPIVVTSDLLLVAGQRRLAAVRQLGWTHVPANIAADLNDALRFELASRDENTQRKDLLPSEMYAQAQRLEPLEQEAAHGRHNEQAKVNLGLTDNANFAPSEKGESRAKIAQAVGTSHGTLRKIETVVKAAEEDPETFDPMVAEMNKTGKVDRVYKRVLRFQSREKALAKVEDGTLLDMVDLREGDFREVLVDLPDESVALIFTDPPYDKASVPLYGDLAELAARVLVPGGSLITYSGRCALEEVMRLLGRHLTYWWLAAAKHNGASTRMPGKSVFAEWKPLLWYVKGSRRDQEFVSDFVTCGPPGEGFKKYHDWQQDIIPAQYYVERLTQEGETVLDPFVGSGTTLLAAVRANRCAVGAEIDPKAAKLARVRLSEALS